MSTSFGKALLGFTLSIALVGTAHADPRAEALAKEAGELMFADPPRYEDAIEKYTQAIVLSPEGKYYFNLCVAYYQYGEFGLALQACDAVAIAGGDDALMTKKNKTLAKVEEQMRKAGQDPDEYRASLNPDPGDGGTGDGGTGDGGTGDGGTGDGGTGDGGTGDGGTGDGGTGDGGGGGTGTGGGGAVGAIDTSKSVKGAPPPSLFASKPPSHDYTWAVGGALLPMGTNIGGDTVYGGGSGFGFRGWVDYTLVPKLKLGVQGYIGVAAITPMESGGDGITTAELGGAAYIHAFTAGRAAITPLLGLQFTGFAPSTGDGSSTVSFGAVGVRAEVSFAYALGKKYENVIHLTPGLNFFAPASGDAGGAGPSSFGLDQSSRAFYLGIGYTRRFDTPFGQAPFITLE